MIPQDDPVASQTSAPPAFDAQAPLVATATPDAQPVPSDRRSAGRVVLWTIGAGLVISGVLEYQGWQIIFRMVPSLPATIPPGDFVLSSLKTLGGALAIGAGVGLVGLLFPSLRRRPWRTLAAGVALGSAAFLGFLAFLVSLAP